MTDLPISAAQIAELEEASARPVLREVEAEVADYRTPEEWGELVRSDLARSVEGFIEAGKHLEQAKSEVKHGDFESIVCPQAGVSAGTARKLMAIAQHGAIANRSHANDLPSSWTSLYELSRMEPSALESAISDGRVNPELERKKARALVAEYQAEGSSVDEPQDETTEVAEGLVSTIVADPPWRYGNTSTRGAAQDHYPTMSIEELCALDDPVDRAAEQAHLYLWTTAGHLPEAFKVMQAWGFTYKTYLVWVKPEMGMGNYFRVSSELVLFGVKGGLRTNDKSLKNWFEASRGKHSAKPEQFHDLVMRASPGPYLEMFSRCDKDRQLPDMCRCSKCRLGWEVWGNQS